MALGHSLGVGRVGDLDDWLVMSIPVCAGQREEDVCRVAVGSGWLIKEVLNILEPTHVSTNGRQPGACYQSWFCRRGCSTAEGVLNFPIALDDLLTS